MFRKIFYSAALGILLFSVSSFTPQTSWACEGTFRPPCGQTAWLAKFVSSSIVLPGSGANITVPIGVVPYVLWSPTANCAQPTTASLQLNLTCTAAGGGSPIFIGPVSVPVGTPVLPGPQAVLTGAGGAPVVGGPFQFPISGGILPVGTSYSCLVQGSYTVNFNSASGIAGAPQVTGLGDTEVCIVEEAPGAPGVPRFDFRILNQNENPFAEIRRGDQAYDSYLMANNDPNFGANITIQSSSNQVAHFPPDDNSSRTLFSLSAPNPGTDNFDQSLLENLPPGGLVPLGDPLGGNTGLMFDRFIDAGGLNSFTIVTRPHGMCLDGSCSEALVKGTGFFDNGDPALGCAGTATVVQEVPASTHQCEVTDTLQTALTVDSQWGPIVFNNDPHLAIHAAGNLDTLGGSPSGTQTTGDVLAEQFGIMGFPPTASDYLRTEEHLNTAVWEAFVFDQASEFVPQYMGVTINNLSQEDFNIIFPAIARDGMQSNLIFQLDASNDHVFIVDGGTNEFVYDGYFTDLVNSPPPGISVDQSTYRMISKVGPPSQPLLGTRPSIYTTVRAPTDPPDSFDIAVHDPRNNQDLPWNASSDNNLLTLSSSSGNAGESLFLIHDPANIAAAPDTTIAFVEVTNAEAINSPVLVPVALRSSTGPSAISQDINYGMAGGWWNALTGGQGFLFDFLTANQLMFLANFTFDALIAAGGGNAGELSGLEALPIDTPEQRWFTAQGNYMGNRAQLTIYQTRNGVFDDPTPVLTTPVGSMEVEFSTCKDARITYDMPDFGLSGVIPLTKLLDDEICTEISSGGMPLHRNKNLSAPEADTQDINYGMIGGWFNALTPGQGFLFDFIPGSQFMFAAAFTFDITSPQSGGNIPGAEQRWFTAQGNYAGNRADLTVYQTSGGVFDDPTEVSTDPVGTMVVEFMTCTSAMITYDLPVYELAGVIPVTKLLADEFCTQAVQ